MLSIVQNTHVSCSGPPDDQNTPADGKASFDSSAVLTANDEVCV